MVALHLIVVLFPVGLLAGLIPVAPRQEEAPGLADNCTITTTLPPVTLTSYAPTSTAGEDQGGSGGGTLVYTTCLPTLGPDGPGLHTYTITYPCPSGPENPCHTPAPTDCPPGFTTTVKVCEVCGPKPHTLTLTVPVITASVPHNAPVVTKTSTSEVYGHDGHGEHGGGSHTVSVKPVSSTHPGEHEGLEEGHHHHQDECEHHDGSEACHSPDETGHVAPEPSSDVVEASAVMFKVADVGALLSMVLMVLLV
ncbi:hypothetical protein SODALDRAFT_348429 [Sodiomyces alkalinus F11]|uniref:Uncharacterized protein n=1 Tax=Sodiomyces alkalinus (strain CBS 110278 / VKM F-3762 / F11) TaxID=1314773 RepID=A0A3N2QAM0_SODAK|nr:hypothetical protein SODALDRAFT_348429 [Sodiomyces alkalinus F11]ROT43799.1 hypothetical protein SODALDRAFT_348429 [Sodiomyces alkalinus F11]